MSYFVSYIGYMRNLAFVNLNLLYKNAISVKEKLKKTTKLCAVVKADAYGHGAERCANALYTVVDCFAVAIAEEGYALRLCGIEKNILVLNPVFLEDIKKCVYYNLILTVTKVEELKNIVAEAERQQRKVKIHIKYNTGMNRYGIDNLNDLKFILSYAEKNPYIIIDGLFSHLACSENKEMLKKAKKKFLLANKLVKSYNDKAIMHLSASGGFLENEEFDMVRIGILLYGYKPFVSDKVDVKPIMRIYAPITERRKLKKGESALYGECKTSYSTDITLVRYGYADGLFRSADKEIFNNRCMDITAYIGNKRGNWFCIMSDADTLAKAYNTISYEVLTKSAFRTEKVYIT